MTFLSDDSYRFCFIKLENPPPIETYLEFSKVDTGFVADEVVPFSGGLDSLAGAVNEVFAVGNRVALVSHRSAPKIFTKQKNLHAEIHKRCAAHLKPLHVPVWVHKHGLRAYENTQRSRSFLYASLAVTVATMFKKNRIRFYENGVISLNLPISEQVLGARATRTTHPTTIAGFQKLFSLMKDGTFEIETPFLWKTKTDVVQLVKDNDQADLIKHCVSCSQVFAMTRLHTHCGCCSQCIDRRLAVFAANCQEYDPDEMYKTDVFIGQRSTKNQDITLAESYVRSMRKIPDMTEEQFFHTYGELTRAITDISEHSDIVAENVFTLYRRNGEQIQRGLVNALGHYAADIAKHDLPDRCLFSQLFGTKIPKATQAGKKCGESAKLSRDVKRNTKHSAVISTLLTHHKYSETQSQNGLNFSPATQENLARLLGWNQSKLCRVIQRSFPSGFWKTYLQACKSEMLKGFLKKLDDETVGIESIHYRPHHPTELEEKEARLHE